MHASSLPPTATSLAPTDIFKRWDATLRRRLNALHPRVLEDDDAQRIRVPNSTSTNTDPSARHAPSRRSRDIDTSYQRDLNVPETLSDVSAVVYSLHAPPSTPWDLAHLLETKHHALARQTQNRRVNTNQDPSATA